jgi:hypothetical protein
MRNKLTAQYFKVYNLMEVDKMSVQTKEHILSLIHEKELDIKSFGVKCMGIFGSFVRNQQKPGSDVDILVEFEPELKTYDNFIHLVFFLERVFERDVDIVTPDALSPYMITDIMRDVEYVAINA